MILKDKYFPVLDYGFIALKDMMGGDEDIEQAARVSYGKGTRKTSETRSLIRYLLRHKHTSPFEMCELKFHVRAPMDCWRQWIRHRTASVNEYSTRYSEAVNLCQQTPPDKWRFQSKNNKQGSDGFVVVNDDTPYAGDWLSFEENRIQHEAYRVYQHRLDSGVAREQARKDLPLSTYTEAFWKIDLHNLLHFLRLRCDSHAQLEIRSYANVIAGIVKYCYPITFEAWEDYTFGAVTFSRQEMSKIYRMIHYGTSLKDVLDDDILTKRETEEFIYKINNDPQQFDVVLPDAYPYEHFQEEYYEKNHSMAKPTS